MSPSERKELERRKLEYEASMRDLEERKQNCLEVLKILESGPDEEILAYYEKQMATEPTSKPKSGGCQGMNKIMLELNIEELRAIQRALRFMEAIKGIIEATDKDTDLQSLKGKIDCFIGDSYELNKRSEYEAGIRETYKGKPALLGDAMKHLEQDYPLPLAYQQ